METYKFKTNIHCNGCKATITPFLDKETTIQKWEVDIDNPDKILTIQGEKIEPRAIINLITKAGYKIELLL